MYPLYKNAHKRLFRSNIKALKGEKMKGFTSVLLLLLPSSPRNLVGDLSFRTRTNTAKTDSRLQHSGMTSLAQVVARQQVVLP